MATISITSDVQINHSFSSDVDSTVRIVDTSSSVEFNHLIEVSTVEMVKSEYSWWNHSWPFRRKLSVTAPPSGLESGHPVHVYIPVSISRMGKTRSNYSDIYVVIQTLTDNLFGWKVLPTKVEKFSRHYKISFNLLEGLEPNQVIDNMYYVYYGNLNEEDIPPVASYVDVEYPLSVTPEGGEITYTNPETDWDGDTSRVNGAKGNFTFYGERVSVYSRRGPDKGQMLVTVTNTSKPEEITPEGFVEGVVENSITEVVDLFLKEDGAVEGDLVASFTGLPDRLHHIRFQDIDSSNPISKGNRVNVIRIEYRKHGLAEDIKEEADNYMQWSSESGKAVV